MQETNVWVELLDEGVTVFAPVPALHLGGRYYKILENNRPDYKPLFGTGTFVFCLLSKFSTHENLVPVAYCEVSRGEAEYISANPKENYQE